MTTPGRELQNVIATLMKFKDSLSSQIPKWVLSMNEGEEAGGQMISAAISELWLVKRMEEGPTQVYDDVEELQTERYNYVLRVRTIMELELEMRNGRFRVRPVRLFSYEEPSITVLSGDDTTTEMTIDEILEEKKREKPFN